MPRKPERPADSYNTALPVRLRETMLANGITQQELGEQIGKSRQAVAQYCNGSSSPDWETIAAIAKYLNVSSDYLLGLSEVESPDATIQGICDYTGLTEGAVEAICLFKRVNDAPVLSSLPFGKALLGLNLLLSPYSFVNSRFAAIEEREDSTLGSYAVCAYFLDCFARALIAAEEASSENKEFEEYVKQNSDIIEKIEALHGALIYPDEMAYFFENLAARSMHDIISRGRERFDKYGEGGSR